MKKLWKRYIKAYYEKEWVKVLTWYAISAVILITLLDIFIID